jgi:heme/copper-type cytochrome/quinol oxidase subunit 2
MKSTACITLVCGLLALFSTLQVQRLSFAQTKVADGQSETSHVFDIVVQRGKRVKGPAVLKVSQGDEVTLHITADTADEFHLHGYNLIVQLLPNSTATMHVVAKLTGRFTYELHKSDLELGALEVYPR